MSQVFRIAKRAYKALCAPLLPFFDNVSHITEEESDTLWKRQLPVEDTLNENSTKRRRQIYNFKTLLGMTE